MFLLSLSELQLALQTYFHSPLTYPLPYPPRPIFHRLRHPTPTELESGTAGTPVDLVPEQSFYNNAYAMVRLSFSS